jgi:hypothetical protein
MYITIHKHKEYFIDLIIDGIHFTNYKISNYGRIFNIKKNKFMKCFKDADGYLKVTIINKDKRLTTGVHRLVAKSFVDGYSSERCFVNHLNCNTEDNYYENLKWVTQRENIEWAIKHGDFDIYRLGMASKRVYDIETITLIQNLLDSGQSPRSVLQEIGYQAVHERKKLTSLIHDIKNNKSHKKNYKDEGSTTIPRV